LFRTTFKHEFHAELLIDYGAPTGCAAWKRERSSRHGAEHSTQRRKDAKKKLGDLGGSA